MSARKEAKEERSAPPAPQSSPQTATTPVKSRSAKAGRNLPAAIGVGVGFGVLLALGLMYQPIFVAIATGAAALGAWEIGHVLNTRRGYGIPEYLLGGLSGAIVVVSYLFGFTGLGIALAVSLLVLLLSSALVRADRQVSLGKSLSGSALALLWVPLMLGIAMVYFQTDHGERGVLMILLMAICNDTFWYWAIPLAAVMVVASTAGDLVESVFKRRMGVKDMSNILPGHGGMMDRLDSILFAAAAGCLIFRFIMPL